MVAVDVTDLDVGADAGVGVDEVGDEVDAAFAVALGLIPVEDAVAVFVGVVAVVGPVAFAGDDVFDAVAVDVGEVGGVGLGEDDAVVVVLGLFGREHDFLPGRRCHDIQGRILDCDIACVGIRALEFQFQRLVLQKHRYAVAMRGEGGEDVVGAVAVEVVGEHLGAAGDAGGEGVLLPVFGSRFAVLGWLLPPVAGF